jgi:ribose/xylose/arabinose/galactoside ABC-type transport system permease subunit
MPRRAIGFLRKRIEVGAAAVAILIIVVFSQASNGVWLSLANMQEVLRVTSVLAVMAFGEALVITVAEIDISIGSVFGIVGLTYLGLAPQIGVPAAIAVALLVGAVIGALNGLIVAYFRIPSLIVTLGSLFLFRGLIYALLQQTPSFSTNDALRANLVYRLFGDTSVFGIHISDVWALGLVVFLSYMLFLTPAGNRLLAVGGDAESARSRGVSIFYTKWGAFIACAFLAGLAGILEASNLGFVDGSFGRQRELQAIAAAVLGGCSTAGGRSSIVGTCLGAFILSGIQSFLVIKAIQPQWFTLLLGLIVVLVSLADRGVARVVTKLAKEG